MVVNHLWTHMRTTHGVLTRFSGALDCSGGNCEVWMAKCDEFYTMEKMLIGLKCPWSGQMRLVCLQAFGMVKFIFIFSRFGQL